MELTLKAKPKNLVVDVVKDEVFLWPEAQEEPGAPKGGPRLRATVRAARAGVDTLCMPMEEFLRLAHHVLTGADLQGDADVRLRFLNRIRESKILEINVEGLNPGRKRLEINMEGI